MTSVGIAEGEPVKIGVAIVEDDATMREGLAIVLDESPGFGCTGRFGSVEEALSRLGQALPNVLLLDVCLPGIRGSEGVRLLREKYPSVQVVMLTSYAEERDIFMSLCNGACGYLLKKATPERILDAVREVCGGGAPMTPEIARRVVQLFRKAPPPETVDYKLTPHEIRLLGLLAQGHSYQRIANEIGVSINTVRTYIRSIYDKLHVHSKSEAVHKALKSRIIC